MKTYEHDGGRCRLMVGDIHAPMEKESGERAGPEILFNVGFYDHTGEFDQQVYGEHWERDSRWYLSHHVCLIIWRWGFSFTLRGKRIGCDWGALAEADGE